MHFGNPPIRERADFIARRTLDALRQLFMRIPMDRKRESPVYDALTRLVEAFDETPLRQRIVLGKIGCYLQRFVLFKRTMRAVPPPQFIERAAAGQRRNPGKSGSFFGVVARGSPLA